MKIYEKDIEDRESHQAMFEELLESSEDFFIIDMKVPVQFRDVKGGKEAHVLGHKCQVVFSEPLMEKVGNKACSVMATRVLAMLFRHLGKVNAQGRDAPDIEFFDIAIKSLLHELTAGNEELQKLFLLKALHSFGDTNGITMVKIPFTNFEEIDKFFEKPKAQA